MGALQNEQRVLRAAIEAELATARSSCAATLESAQVNGSGLVLYAAAASLTHLCLCAPAAPRHVHVHAEC